jgi:hypothetical protein
MRSGSSAPHRWHRSCAADVRWEQRQQIRVASSRRFRSHGGSVGFSLGSKDDGRIAFELTLMNCRPLDFPAQDRVT